MSYEIVTSKKMVLSGIKIKTTNENQKCIKDMGELWKKFFSENVIQKAGKPVGYSTFGLYLNYEGDFTKPYEYMACVEVSPSSNDFETVSIPEGKFAKFTKEGNILEIVGALWYEIWNTGLKRTYNYDFEKYYQGEDESNQKVEIYIGIE